MTGFTGRCLCGAVRFGFAGAPVATRACWCRDCQYLSSGNASVNAIFRVEGFTLEGEVAAYASTADSGNAMRRSFCPRCGTPLFSQSSARPELMVVRVGALDDREAMRPGGIIWTASAPGWAVLDPDVPHTGGQPAGAPTAAST
jgi:hypothetical protein